MSACYRGAALLRTRRGESPALGRRLQHQHIEKEPGQGDDRDPDQPRSECRGPSEAGLPTMRGRAAATTLAP